MFQKIYQAIKDFLANHVQHAGLEHLLLYFAIAGAVIFLVIWIIKVIKEDRRLNKEKRRIEKSLLKSLGRKNKTN